MIIMSLRDSDLLSKQSPVSRGDCFATCARNDMQTGCCGRYSPLRGRGCLRVMCRGDSSMPSVVMSSE